MPLSNPITEQQIPPPIARDEEFQAADNAHLAATDPHLQYATQARGDARYFRGRSQIYTLDPPSLPAGELHKVFVTFAGANLGDACVVVPINVNMFTFALWPFTLAGVVESTNNIGVYLRNDFSGPLDLASFQIRVLVFNF